MNKFKLAQFDHAQLLNNTINAHNKVNTLQMIAMQQPAQQSSISQQILFINQEISSCQKQLKEVQIHQIQLYLLTIKQYIFEEFSSKNPTFQPFFDEICRDFKSEQLNLQKCKFNAFRGYCDDLAQTYTDLLEFLEVNFREICQIVRKFTNRMSEQDQRKEE